MLASPRLARSNNARRAAFTLVEVLVVVAIVVILASVGTIAVFKVLEDAKVDTARTKAATLLKYSQQWSARNDSAMITQETLPQLAEYAEDGERALFDPWGNPYYVEMRVDPATGRQRLYMFCRYESPRTGQVFEYGAPKELEPQGQQ